MPADVKLFKAALEDAKFDDPMIRELLVDCINALSDDLEDAEYISSPINDEIFDKLEEYLADSEEVIEVVAVEEKDEDEDEDDEDEEDDEEEDEEDDEEDKANEEDDDLNDFINNVLDKKDKKED